MHINPYLFVIPRAPNPVLWDYKRHKQYELSQDYLSRILQLTQSPERFNPQHSIDIELLDAGILTRTEQADIDWGWDDLSKIFHIGTKNIPCAHIPQNIEQWARLYLDHCTEVQATAPPPSGKDPSVRLIPLPAAASLEHRLHDALLQRKTCRSFTGEALSLSDLGTLLYLSLGYLHEREADRDDCVAEGLGDRRCSPSGGGLNACEGLIQVHNVSGLDPGLYRYHSADHALSPVGPLPGDALGLLLCGQHFINNLPLGLYITARFDKLWWKYPHSRAYRMAFVEAGHIAQTFQLVATALGLNTWLTGALTDDKVEAALGLEHSAEQPLFFVGCGKSDGQAMCKELKALMQRDG